MAFSFQFFYIFYIPNGSLSYGYSRCDGLFGKRPPTLRPGWAGPHLLVPFNISKFCYSSYLHFTPILPQLLTTKHPYHRFILPYS